jgi:GntR family transcriptional regulator
MSLTIDHRSKMPLHAQVEELLRELIASPKYQKGEFLPTEVELANRLGVSRNTIRQATNKLEYEGLLIRKKGVGTKVAPTQVLSTSLSNWHSFTKEMQSRGIDVVNLSLELEKVRANEKMASFFNIQVGTPVVKLSKLKGVGKSPIVFFESFFHPRIELTHEDDLRKPLYQLLEDKYGIVVDRSSENISSRIAGNLAKKLDVPKQAPILFRERFVYDPGGRPIEYGLGYYRSDKFVYSIEIKNSQA